MKAKDNFLLSSFAFSPVKSYHRNSMILHGRKGATETKYYGLITIITKISFQEKQEFISLKTTI
jgi:hypothetical protein